MDDSILGYDTRWRAEERSKGVVLSTYHTTQVQATAVSVSWRLFTVLLSPPPYFTTRHDRTIFFLHACGTQTSFKKKVTGWGSITLTSSYQFDFVLPFVISPLGDNCHLRMHKSKAQGFFVSDLLQLKLGCIYMWLWQPSSFSAKLLVWFMLFKSPVHFQACSAALSFRAATFCMLPPDSY